MTQELKNDLIVSWNDTEDLFTSFSELNNDELIEFRPVMAEKLGRIRDLLGKYVDENDIIELI